MNTSEARKLWAEALESGEYEQTIGQLQDGNGFCCLGVACEVAEAQGVRVIRDWKTDDLFGPDLQEQRDVKAWLGLSNDGGYFDASPKPDKQTTWTSLARLNDEGKTTFENLAAIIRAEPRGLFNE